MQERRLVIKMERDEFNAFKAALEKGTADVTEYIQQYIAAHEKVNLSQSDVLSLTLVQAIRCSPSSVNGILSIPHEGNILATVDISNHSPISSLFYGYPEHNEAMDAIKNYLQVKGMDLPKVDLKGKTFLYLHSAMQGTLFDLMTVFDNVPYVREHFLKYIYSEKSLNQFESTFVENFSPKEYLSLGHEEFFKQWQPKTFKQKESESSDDDMSVTGYRSEVSSQESLNNVGETQKKSLVNDNGLIEQKIMKELNIIIDSSVHTNKNSNVQPSFSNSSVEINTGYDDAITNAKRIKLTNGNHNEEITAGLSNGESGNSSQHTGGSTGQTTNANGSVEQNGKSSSQHSYALENGHSNHHADQEIGNHHKLQQPDLEKPVQSDEEHAMYTAFLGWVYKLPEWFQEQILNSAPIQQLMHLIKETSLEKKAEEIIAYPKALEKQDKDITESYPSIEEKAQSKHQDLAELVDTDNNNYPVTEALGRFMICLSVGTFGLSGSKNIVHPAILPVVCAAATASDIIIDAFNLLPETGASTEVLVQANTAPQEMIIS